MLRRKQKRGFPQMENEMNKMASTIGKENMGVTATGLALLAYSLFVAAHTVLTYGLA